jgi:hypothetical protein
MEKMYHLFILICLLPFALFYVIVLWKGFGVIKKRTKVPGVPKMRNPPPPPNKK